MKHYFEVDIAVKYGVEAAVLLEHFEILTLHNKRNEQNYRDGHYWTYDSRKALKDTFPYMSEYAIDAALKRLKDDGLILTGCYNRASFDRTTWYTLTDKGYNLLEKEHDKAKTSNGMTRNQEMEHLEIAEPIPRVIIQENNNNKKELDSLFKSKEDIQSNKDIDSKKDIEESNKDKTKKFIPPTVDEVAAYCRERKNGINAESFVDFYESKGWLIGKNKMKDWRAAVRTWERNNYSSKEKGKIYDSVDDDDIVIVRAW